MTYHTPQDDKPKDWADWLVDLVFGVAILLIVLKLLGMMR